MSILDTITSRRSIRNYRQENVPDELLHTVLESARCAQSAKNIQNWHFIVVQDADTRNRLSVAARGQHFVAEAPVVIVCCGLETGYKMTCGQYAYTIDVAIAMENMALTAHESGLGTCWLGAFHEDQVKNICGIPGDDIRVVGLMTLGYPAATPGGKPRKPLDEIVSHERWE